VRRTVLLAAVLALALSTPAPAATIQVTNNSDTNGVCNPGVSCSLREAIKLANSNGTTDAITFTGTMVITPANALPALTEPVTISGKFGVPLDVCGGSKLGVQLDGDHASFAGLRLIAGADGSRICGLNVRAFDNGIRLVGPSMTVDDSYIGTDNAGETGDPNLVGVFVSGADATVTGNVISGNILGIEIDAGTTGTLVTDNLIGTDDGGHDDLGNNDGMTIGANTTATIGGSSAARNVISGSTFAGINARSGTISGNYIGTDVEGDDDLGNGFFGVWVLGGTTTVIGGDTVGERNVITGNGTALQLDATATVQGNWIGPAADGVLDLNETGDAVVVKDGAATITGNVIAGKDHYPVSVVEDADGVTVRDNLLGLGPDGVTVAPNDTGVNIESPSVNTTVEGNTIAGGGGSGIETGADGTVIRGNRIGVDTTGAVTATSTNDHAVNIVTDAGESTTVGGTGAGQGNVLSGARSTGVRMGAGSATLLGNTIDRNEDHGIEALSTADMVVGGTGAGAGNHITGNGHDGINVAPTAVVRARGNSIHANGPFDPDIGIDLGVDGPSGNDPGDTDPGRQNKPFLTGAETDGTTTAITGTLDTTPGKTIAIDVYSNTACDPSGEGEGEVFLGTFDVTAGTGATPFSGSVGATPAGRAITATATNDGTNQKATSEFSQCFTATQKPDPPDDGGGGGDDGGGGDNGGGGGTTTPPADTGTTPPPPPLVTAPPLVVPPPVIPKFPAKIAVLRNGVDDGVLDMLIQITSRSVTPGAVLELDYNSSGKHTRFEVPVTSTQIKVRRKLPKSQPKDTGIVEVEYAGNDAVSPDAVRLRAADGKSKLVRTKSSVTGGRLAVEGTVNAVARGVVRNRLEYTRPDGSTAFLYFNATIKGGKWKLSQTLPAEAAGGGQLSIQFTGYEPENLRGEQVAKQVLATR
jgi:CSLREA domain-containing protein